MSNLRVVSRPRVKPLAALFLAALVLDGCGGGGSNGGGGTPPPTPTPPPTAASIQFTPTSTPGAATIHLARGAGSTTTTLQLEVRANQMTGLYGVTFDLGYPAALLNYTTFTPGDFFASGNGDPSIQVFESPDGNLVIGATLLGNQGGISGSGVILTLQLAAAAGGSGPITFSSQDALAFNGNSLFGVSWFAGSVQVTQ